MFVYERYAKVFGLCELLFGEVTLLQDPFKWIDPLFIGIPLSVAALIIGILIVRQSKSRQRWHPANPFLPFSLIDDRVTYGDG